MNYKWIKYKHFIDENEQILEANITYWQNIPLNNFNYSNFYFLINNFFSLNKNIKSLTLMSLEHNNIKIYDNSSNEKKIFPNKFNFNENDSSFFFDFIYLRQSSYIKFFMNNMIDVPICFKKSKSLKSKNFELPLLKFSNFLMKQGKREKITNTLTRSFRNFFLTLKPSNVLLSDNFMSWVNLYYITNNFSWYSNSFDSEKFFYQINSNFELNFNNSTSFNQKIINTSFFLKSYFLTLISKVSPVFSYFIYSVDKNIRKYSRGKSGKYTFIWKYVAAYKRIKLSMRWIVKDIKFYQSKQLQSRLHNTFDNLLTTPEKSFSWKSKIFSHNYVFKNFRKSLMSSLRTTS